MRYSITAKKKWVNRENATKKDVFLMGQIFIDKFKGFENDHEASTAKEKYSG